jgi:hypothetical protein
VSVDHEVGRLQIAVKNPTVVRRLETVADFDCDTECFVRGEPADPPQERREIFPLDMLHRNKVMTIYFIDIEDPADIRVCNLPRQADFVEEQLQAAAVAGIVGTCW